MKSKLTCVLFGHISKKDTEYFEIGYFQTDKQGRRHGVLFTECCMCGKRFQIGKVLLPIGENSEE